MVGRRGDSEERLLFRYLRHGSSGIGLPENYRPPLWYTMMRAADRLHIPVVPVKEIRKVPMFWIHQAMVADRVEGEADAARRRDELGGLLS